MFRTFYVVFIAILKNQKKKAIEIEKGNEKFYFLITYFICFSVKGSKTENCKPTRNIFKSIIMSTEFFEKKNTQCLEYYI